MKDGIAWVEYYWYKSGGGSRLPSHLAEDDRPERHRRGWMITPFQSLPANDPNAQSGKVTAVVTETAKVDPGPVRHPAADRRVLTMQRACTDRSQAW